jgi:predicted RNA-binding protein (virulence factor B family)
MPILTAGTFVELEVARQVDFGYFLTDGYEDVLLHQAELKTNSLEIGENIEVFLYHDHQNRLSATMHKPALVYGEAAWLRVIDINQELGVFLDQELRRDLLLPKSELPLDENEWPRMGDHLFVELTHDRQGRMIGMLGKTEWLLEDFIEGTSDMKNTTLIGTVYNQYPDGAFLTTGEGHILFLPRPEMASPVRLGQEVKVRVTFVRDDGRMNVSTKPLKQDAMSEDSAQIVTYLQGRGGSMPYYDKTPPDIILEKFNMSKASFKRALGSLMKQNRVYQEEGWTYLKENE